MAEAYNSLRTALLYSTPEGMPPVVFVTSSGAGEGKSTTSYALAQGLARLDKRVVLIDVDLRRPAQHRAFGLSNDEGMSDLLTSHREVGSVIRTTAVANRSEEHTSELQSLMRSSYAVF